MKKRSRGIGFGLLLGLMLAAFFMSDAEAQYGGGGAGGGTGGGGMGGGMGRRGQGPSANKEPIPDKSASPRTTDPEAYDAIDLFSRLCVSTRGSRARAIGIVGDGDTAIEQMDAPTLRGLEGGRSDGIGWIISMPLGDKILLEFPPDGACIVRAPRVNAAQMETAFRNLLDQYSASGQFGVKRLADQNQTVDDPDRKSEKQEQHVTRDELSKPDENKIKFHILAYTMTLPDADKTARLLLATTESRATSIQATLSFTLGAEGGAAPPR
jgi:hypothetical protein